MEIAVGFVLQGQLFNRPCAALRTPGLFPSHSGRRPAIA